MFSRKSVGTRFDSVGTCKIKLTVKDESNNIDETTIDITVSEKSASSNVVKDEKEAAGNLNTSSILVAVILVVLTVIAVFVFYTRSKKNR